MFRHKTRQNTREITESHPLRERKSSRSRYVRDERHQRRQWRQWHFIALQTFVEAPLSTVYPNVPLPRVSEQDTQSPSVRLPTATSMEHRPCRCLLEEHMGFRRHRTRRNAVIGQSL